MTYDWNEEELRSIATEWYKSMNEEQRMEAFVGMVVCQETEVVAHIKTVVSRSKGERLSKINKEYDD